MAKCHDPVRRLAGAHHAPSPVEIWALRLNRGCDNRCHEPLEVARAQRLDRLKHDVQLIAHGDLQLDERCHRFLAWTRDVHCPDAFLQAG
jgi:hypothetical protein